MTATAIAAALGECFGVTVSRNVIIGKAARTGLQLTGKSCGNRSPLTAEERERRQRERQWRWHEARMRKRRELGLSEKRKPTLPPPEVIDQLIPFEQRKQLLELEHGMCKWPVGDPGEPGLFFCGGNANGSYCASHFIRSISRR
jgi:GcrA cell cycle regulator